MLTLILGGARSGKSHYAQTLCQNADSVLYLATAPIDQNDEEMLNRISRHRTERPDTWTTVEETLDIERILLGTLGTEKTRKKKTIVLVDCITIWLANLGWHYRHLDDETREREILNLVKSFAQAASRREVIAVTNEVGSGIVPETRLGRTFR
ncbi:MAG: bifunctional adenosylcobinamide kinase/adenosylcobinamide-phosphate guanylyltransferase, partial [Pyrinomonadaceae bacterium]